MTRRVVITGLGAVSPIGNSIESLWESLVQGRHGIAPITGFDTEGYKVKIAAEVKNFDPKAVFEDKTEIRRTDKFSQYAVSAALQAVTDSGLSEEDLCGAGVYIGSGVGGMQTFYNESVKLREKGPDRISPFFITMMITNIAAGLVAKRFGAHGPTLPVTTACASSTNTIGEAFRAIKHGYADVIIAGGAEAAITELSIAGFTNCNALCESNDPDRSSIPFDAHRSGFVMGDGAAVLVLEDYEKASARGAKIYGEICGYGNTCDAYHVTSPHPEALYASAAIGEAMKEGSIDPGMDIYINAHGTSTPMNDRTETIAIKRVFGHMAGALSVSSTKSMTGHMLGAAGAVEAVISLLALHKGIIPPTVGLKVSDPECDLDYTPGKARIKQCECAISNSFGFGGHNASLVFKKL